MKKEQIVALLLSSVFAYRTIRWLITIYQTSMEYHYIRMETILHFGLHLAGIAALIQYFATAYKRSQFLRAYLVYLIVIISVDLIISSLILTTSLEESNRTARLTAYVIELVEIILSCLLLSFLKNNRTPQLSITKNENGEPVSHYIPASLLQRFFNRVLDIALLGYVAYANYDWWRYVVESMQYEIPYGVIFLTHPFLLYVVLIIYYVVMEYAFRTSFGKIITGTTIIRAAGGYPGLGAIIARTFCRFLPANSISFFFYDDERGWQDRLSGTGVVEERYLYQPDFIE
ncbi:MAG: hypothetical protein C0523_04265 [Cytophaga sp.]|nr:hypothetical protein [Cytophaga sp.]